MSQFRAYVFDLDGTLVDSQLDFVRLRVDLGISPNTPILEEIKTWPATQQTWAHQVIDQHELAGAKISTLYPGVADFLKALELAQIPRALFTRNSRQATELTLKKHGLEFHQVITRDDAPPKPDPTGLLQIVQNLKVQPPQTLYVGDYLYDLKAGRAAQIPTALYLPNTPADFDTDGAHFVFSDFAELIRYLG